MILVDTNIVSTFARVDALALLTSLMKEPKLYIAPATFHELRAAVKAGCAFLEPIVADIKIGGEIDVLQLTRDEIIATAEMPTSLGAGECESIAVCLARRDVRFLTNDKRARNYCRERQIVCLDLPEILRAMWVQRAATKIEVRKLIDDIERENGMVISNSAEILGEATRPKGRRKRN